MVDFENLNYDADGDGVMDSFAQEMDTNGDGIVDSLMIDIGGDGTIDILASDTDGDGAVDIIMMDTDGDGDPDTMLTDADENGIPEEVRVELDTDGDGQADEVQIFQDADQDGQMEGGTVFLDTDGDGNPDLISQMADTDGDGMMDQVVTYADTDGDGTADAVMQETFLDTDGDGTPDTYVVQVDADGDQEFEESQTFRFNPETGEIAPLDQAENGVGYVQDLENFDPDEADPDKVVGDPEESMEQWEFQGNTGRCALYSQKFIIEELTGEEIDIEEMADMAEENNWFSEENGTPLLHMNKMLDAYGIDNEMSFHNDEEDLRECLENGGKVIVSVDADEIWYGETDDMFAPVDGPNHAVQVIGIDYSDPENPMVILNDSGSPDGCGEMVPLDVFMDAWEDGDCQMIVCY